jgi:hypothetical protein
MQGAFYQPAILQTDTSSLQTNVRNVEQVLEREMLSRNGDLVNNDARIGSVSQTAAAIDIDVAFDGDPEFNRLHIVGRLEVPSASCYGSEMPPTLRSCYVVIRDAHDVDTDAPVAEDKLHKYGLSLAPSATGTSVSIEIPSQDASLFRRFDAAITGDPTATVGSFWRMTYFSVVTITTLGFGDIVPRSDVGRRVVGIEALLGVILIGLFFAAIGKEVGRAVRTPRPVAADTAEVGEVA